MRSILNKKHSQYGFTLIEMMVVVSIISFLGSVMMVSLVTARRKSRDVRRMTDMRNVINMLTDYEIKNGRYPCHFIESSLSSNFMAPLVNEGYIPSTLRDPLNDATFHYYYGSFKDPNNGGCGRSVVLEMTLETTSACPAGGTAYSVTHVHGPGIHCHMYFPAFPPPPCNTQAILEDPYACSLVDNVNDY